MTTYTQEELRQIPDNDLEMIYREVTAKPFDPTKKKNDVIDEIITKQSEYIQIPDQIKKSRKKPVGKVRSTMLQTMEAPRVISNLLMSSDAELDVPSYDVNSLKNTPKLKIMEQQKVTEQKVTEPIQSPKRKNTRSSPSKSQTRQKKISPPQIEQPTIQPDVEMIPTNTQEENIVSELQSDSISTNDKDSVSNEREMEPEMIEKIQEKLNEMRMTQMIPETNEERNEGKMEVEEPEITIPPPPPLRKGRPKKEDSLKKITEPPRRGRPPSDKKLKKSMNMSETLSESSIGSSMEESGRMVLNPSVSLQKIDVNREREIINPVLMMNSNVISEVLPMSEKGKQKITSFLHSVPWSKIQTNNDMKSVVVEESRPIEDQIENITSGISQMTMERPKRTRASPKVKMIDDEIEQLTKRIKALETKKSQDTSGKKSIQDLISESIDIQTPKRAPRKKASKEKSQNDLVTRIDGMISDPNSISLNQSISMSIESIPSNRETSGRSRTSTKTTSSNDIVEVLKMVDKNKVSGKRGKNFYSAEELMNFLTQIQLPTSGNKEAIAQRLLDVIEKYRL